MSDSISKRKFDVEAPIIIAKAKTAVNLQYLKDLATGDCWEVFQKKSPDEFTLMPLLFKSSGMTAIIMPMSLPEN